jgi:cytochrome d ubiquinol oxidase subunit I
MGTTALLLSRIQFASTISFHIIFPAFTIVVAAWLSVLQALFLKSGRPAYPAVFEFWCLRHRRFIIDISLVHGTLLHVVL